MIIILIENESTESKMKKDSALNRFENRLINRDNALNIILILLDLCFNSMRKRYKYSEARIKRKLNFSINVIFMLFCYTISIIAK